MARLQRRRNAPPLLAAWAAQAYCDRWQIETAFYVMKQEFAQEKARVRTFRRLENIFSLCVLAYVYATRFLRASKGFRKILKFLSDNMATISTKTDAPRSRCAGRRCVRSPAAMHEKTPKTRIPRTLGLAGKKPRPLRGRPENVFRPVFSGVCEKSG